jgi:hypothetical protein
MTIPAFRSSERNFGQFAYRQGRSVWAGGDAQPQGGAPTSYDPASLFAAGEQGGWYSPSDLSSVFQDDQGLLPVTGDGDPVGLVVDLSGNNADLKQSDPARGPIWRTDGASVWLEYDGVNSLIKTVADYVIEPGWTLASGWMLASGGNGSGLSPAMTLATNGVNYLSIGQRQSPPFASFGDRLNNVGVDTGAGGAGSMLQDTPCAVLAEWTDTAPFAAQMYVNGGEVASFDAEKLALGQSAGASFGAMATPGAAAAQLRRTYNLFFIDRVLTVSERSALTTHLMEAAGIS